MTLSSTPAKLAQIGSYAAGIEAYRDPPPGVIDTAMAPLLYVLTGKAVDSSENTSFITETRMYHATIAVVPVGQANPDVRETRCRPILEAVKAKYRSYEHLGVDFVQSLRVTGDSGIVVLPDYDGTWVGFQIHLEVTEIRPISYAKNE